MSKPTKPAVQHFISVNPEEHIATRARITKTDLVDDVTLFANDKMIGVLCVPSGRGPELCQQMGLVDRNQVTTFEDIKTQFEQLLSSNG